MDFEFDVSAEEHKAYSITVNDDFIGWALKLGGDVFSLFDTDLKFVNIVPKDDVVGTLLARFWKDG